MGIKADISRTKAQLRSAKRAVKSAKRRVESFKNELAKLEHDQAILVGEAAARKKARDEAEAKVRTPDDMWFEPINVDEQPALPKPVPRLGTTRGLDALLCTVPNPITHPYFNGYRFDWYICGAHITSEMPAAHANDHATDAQLWKTAWESLNKNGRVTVWVRPMYRNRDKQTAYGNRYNGPAVASDYFKLAKVGGKWTLVFEKERT